ncbi:sigma factor [Streptomyces sp. SAS_281]|uniref:sigma factor n=1 Tax=Streptomyces sp. SAS_281 TaxID=3412744 RepID=UPI00403D12BA
MDTTNDRQRFTELYRERNTDVESYVRRRVDPSQVNDVVSEVFVVVWRRMEDAPGDRPLPWLYGVARRTLANAYRSERRRSALPQFMRGPPGVGEPFTEIPPSVAFRALNKRLRALWSLT